MAIHLQSMCHELQLPDKQIVYLLLDEKRGGKVF